MDKVVVGLSGGVDSSVAAATLHHQGYHVEGLTLWLMKGKGQCCSEGMVDAASICEQLEIPHHVVDTRDLFQTHIIDYVISGYEDGVTPLPCSQCNRTVKFPPMLAYAKETLGIDKIATGHYARIQYDSKGDRFQLLKAVDDNKDQSYFLYDLTQELLAHLIFPLGNQTKTQTREMASKFNLSTAEKPESQDLCLIEAHGSMKDFLDQYIKPKQGEIVDLRGNILGEHDGVHHYTIGQRKGLGVAYSEPLYVVKLDTVMNRVIVATRDEGGKKECTVARMNWVSIAQPSAPIQAEAKIRYRSTPESVNVVPLDNDRVKLIFPEPQFGITPGQAAVLYHGDMLLGGGIIEKDSE
ncbi:tRNA 2-thiouridine(34) synthase MnmA [Cyanobacterium sp. IPPAS B-1200]|uniref:tRNA 2-thiouridine(34) synthase MnmA n=1 Tax=Cyanobacterium sp. IPPAS B-1200 TaxID=1562720 RepID=UPI0008525B41|nr:tRNA 2-thiouridine(34) synthase MnmA [Cyanobacterium sp. IPPAS B-1200]OEJ79063.1 tRNA 2-thiouridine(34) synthase MnmA [Cyanobacterium sp. IPPAS B-1200]